MEGNGDAANTTPEDFVTMVDVLEEEKELQEEYAAVLGASDEKCCTYAQGAIKRQALYSCLTCCPESRNDLTKCAGICLACSYRCHENHELIELYTKRNFRCDCPTERLGTNRCFLNESKDEKKQPNNTGNEYNQNFQGLYCTCKRPYPDPEQPNGEEMWQCAICEDWYHLQHLDVPATAKKLVEACCEIICGSCMQRNTFLQDYTGLSLKALEDLDDSQMNITVTGETSILADEDNGDNKLRSDLDKSISDIMNMSEGDKEEEKKRSLEREDPSTAATEATSSSTEPPAKRQKTESNDGEEQTSAKKETKSCCRPSKSNDYEKGATFWGNDWRSALCQCDDCVNLYKSLKVEFLLDAEDSSKSYEERGKKRAATEIGSTYEQGIRALASIGRVQQIDVITEYNRMKDKLMDYLQTFAVNKKVVTEEDINRFFEQMRKDKNTNLGSTYSCR